MSSTHPYISRVSNDDVRAVAGCKRLSQVVLARQLKLYSRIVALPAQSLVRRVAIEPDGVKPICFAHKRRQGRPRLRWSICTYAHACNAAGGEAELSHLLVPHARSLWQRAIRQYWS